MRLIDADAIIEVMKKCAENPENAQALLCYRYTQKILEEAPTVEPFAPWHRVEEELPKEEGRYFIAVFYKGKWLYNVAWFVKDIGDILGVPGSDGNGGFVSNSAEVYPDCWMMPIEPPKEETK